MRQIQRALSILIAAAALLVTTGQAHAGRGGSYARIASAIRSGNADAIIAELERAERLVCGACIDLVMPLLDHEDYRVREVAAWWFARRPAQKQEITELGIARLYGDDALLARNAADALGTFRHPGALPALAHAAARQDFPAETRRAAVMAIGTIADPRGEPAVVLAMGDGAPEVRAEAIRSYWALRGSRTGAPVAALLADADAGVRAEAAAVVGHFAFAGARQALEQLVASDPDSFVRRNAAWALGKIGDAASRPVLEAAAKNDPSSLVRSVAQAAIRGLR